MFSVALEEVKLKTTDNFHDDADVLLPVDVKQYNTPVLLYAYSVKSPPTYLAHLHTSCILLQCTVPSTRVQLYCSTVQVPVQF